jgi:hypothetical protein
MDENESPDDGLPPELQKLFGSGMREGLQRKIAEREFCMAGRTGCAEVMFRFRQRVNALADGHLPDGISEHQAQGLLAAWAKFRDCFGELSPVGPALQIGAECKCGDCRGAHDEASREGLRNAARALLNAMCDYCLFFLREIERAKKISEALTARGGAEPADNG